MLIFWKDKLVVLERSVMTSLERGKDIKNMLTIALLSTLGKNSGNDVIIFIIDTLSCHLNKKL